MLCVRVCCCVVQLFHRVSSSWIPQYTMVAFTRIPYDEALQRARKQDRILQRLAIGVAGVATALALGSLFSLARSKYPGLLPTVDCKVTQPKWFANRK